MPIQDMPAGSSVRDLRFVGHGVCADVLERAHLRTVRDLHNADLDDVTPEGPMKRVWSAIEAAKEDPEWCDVRDWVRVGRSAYYSPQQTFQNT